MIKRPPALNRSDRGRAADLLGRGAESAVAAHLAGEGWQILGLRLRTPAGEIDLAADRDGLLLLAEVKSRPSHDAAALALLPRQQKRLIGAAHWLLAENPDWGREGVRFDVFLVDQTGSIAQITDAIRDDSAL